MPLYPSYPPYSSLDARLTALHRSDDTSLRYMGLATYQLADPSQDDISYFYNLTFDEPGPSGLPGLHETQWLTPAGQSNSIVPSDRPPMQASYTTDLNAGPSGHAAIDPRVLSQPSTSTIPMSPSMADSGMQDGAIDESSDPQIQFHAPPLPYHSSAMTPDSGNYEVAEPRSPVACAETRSSGPSRTRQGRKTARARKPYDAEAPRRTTRAMTADARAPGSSRSSSSSEAFNSSGPSTPGSSSLGPDDAHIFVQDPACNHTGNPVLGPDTGLGLTQPLPPLEPTKKRRSKAPSRKPATGGIQKKKAKKAAPTPPVPRGPESQKFVACQVLLPETGKPCGWTAAYGDANAIDKHVAEHWDAYGSGNDGKMTCKWKGCASHMASHPANRQDWQRHVRTLPAHFALAYHCPIAGCDYSQRIDIMSRHLNSVHRDQPPPENWKQGLQPCIDPVHHSIHQDGGHH
ncbi:hypothetical protein OBBRIDRAFT_826505 [Obba rivulosa]|uniref:Uncharacterized protein n=1 Tax=Obba rivulosa TaxID=1052685 RepID=A0A8E2DL48_9APHY|nr:hypothetical protein OBBRIDRAFT_826505 [Obba rivulosa]